MSAGSGVSAGSSVSAGSLAAGGGAGASRDMTAMYLTGAAQGRERSRAGSPVPQGGAS